MIKKLIALIICVLFTTAATAATTKIVCHKVKQKNGRIVNQCKTIKVHKMHQGTKVPTTKKK